MTANNIPNQGTQSVSAIFPKNLDLGVGTDMPNFVVRFDAWNNTGDAACGTCTNYQIAGVNFEAGPVQQAEFNSDTTAAQGAMLGITADNGAFDDYQVAYGGKWYFDRGDESADTDFPERVFGDGSDPPSVNNSGLVNADILIANGGDTTFAGSAGSAGAEAAYYSAAFPANESGLPAGVPTNRWATHEVSVVDGIFSYVIDGFVFVQKDLSEVPDVSLSGTAMLGFWDRFSSVADSPPGGNFVIYDNIEIDILNDVPVVDISDFIVTPELVGDLNGDGFVGAGDLDILLGVWNQNDSGAADLNEDGFIGAGDLDILLGNWNAGTPPTSVAAVPEPASLALLGLGGLAMLRRRR